MFRLILIEQLRVVLMLQNENFEQKFVRSIVDDCDLVPPTDLAAAGD